jgi:exodeoxyribonuclease VII large subunit
VITSPTGAALRDVLISLKRRFPAVDVLIYATSVQGARAAPEIAAALARASARAECDLLILTRGGGSLEDLWPFNEEIVARAIAASTVPVISGVGHETDFTIADFVADLRAPTPSQAAELAVPDSSIYQSRLRGVGASLERFLRRRLRDLQLRQDTLLHRLGRVHPGVIVRGRQQRLDEIEARMKRAVQASIQALATRAKLAARGLESLNPLATLERGYAIVCRADTGALVMRSDTVATGVQIDVRLAAGNLKAVVQETRGPARKPAGTA